MTLNRNINWLKSTYVNLHCAGNIIKTKVYLLSHSHEVIITLQYYYAVLDYVSVIYLLFIMLAKKM